LLIRKGFGTSQQSAFEILSSLPVSNEDFENLNLLEMNDKDVLENWL